MTSPLTRRCITRRHLGLAALGLTATLAALSAAAAAQSKARLVLVHGRGQAGLDVAALQATWLRALEAGAAKLDRELPADLDIVFPYYGDALEAFVAASQLPLTADIQTRGAVQDDEFLLFQAAVAEELRQAAGVTDAEIDAEYGDDPRERGPLNWAWVQAILRAIDSRAEAMSQAAIEAFTRDVYLYTTRFGVRDEIDRIVADALAEDVPTVLVAHSLGSVVAYNLLRTERRRLDVPLFVTVGSPLGIRAVRSRLVPLRYPAPVGRWLNVFDPRDVVALFALDDEHFPVQPAIENYPEVVNHTENRHGIIGYLDDAVVCANILDGLDI